jgi:hypothetical protein
MTMERENMSESQIHDTKMLTVIPSAHWQQQNVAVQRISKGQCDRDRTCAKENIISISFRNSMELRFRLASLSSVVRCAAVDAFSGLVSSPVAVVL